MDLYSKVEAGEWVEEKETGRPCRVMVKTSRVDGDSIINSVGLRGACKSIKIVMVADLNKEYQFL